MSDYRSLRDYMDMEPGHKKAVFAYIFANAYPTSDEVAYYCHIDRATTHRLIQELEAEGKIFRHGNRGHDKEGNPTPTWEVL